MKFKIKWLYPTRDRDNAVFEQTYSLSINEKQSYVRAPSFCAGVYISNLINACNVDEHVEGYRRSRAYSAWRQIIDERDTERRYLDERANYMLYDSVTFPAFCIHNNIKTMLKEIGNSIVKRDRNELSDSTKDFLGDRIIDMLGGNGAQNDDSQDAIQNRIDEYVHNYTELLADLRSDKGDGFYERLCDSLEKYNDGNHRLIKEYLSERNKGGRCFATFIEQSDNTKKYVSFSGFVDAEDPVILRWLNKAKSEEFCYVAREICRALNAEFVPINENTRKYLVDNYSAANVRQDMSIGDLIANNVGSDIVGQYSCCERKIFGSFNDNTPNGTLYVKFKICAECALGLTYQHRNGNIIVLHDGLGY